MFNLTNSQKASRKKNTWVDSNHQSNTQKIYIAVSILVVDGIGFEPMLPISRFTLHTKHQMLIAIMCKGVSPLFLQVLRCKPTYWTVNIYLYQVVGETGLEPAYRLRSAPQMRLETNYQLLPYFSETIFNFLRCSIRLSYMR